MTIKKKKDFSADVDHRKIENPDGPRPRSELYRLLDDLGGLSEQALYEKARDEFEVIFTVSNVHLMRGKLSYLIMLQWLGEHGEPISDNVAKNAALFSKMTDEEYEKTWYGQARTSGPATTIRPKENTQ